MHPDVDVVAVAVQLPHHDELVTAALNAGKHVFCEWPLAVDARHAEQLRDLARHQRVHHMVGLQGRRNPAVHYVRDLVTQGYVGEVLGATLTQSTPMFWARNCRRVWPGRRTRAAGEPADRRRRSRARHLASLPGRVPRGLGNQGYANTPGEVAGTGETVEVSAPDQVLVKGMLESGALASAHFQGGAPHGSGARLRSREVRVP